MSKSSQNTHLEDHLTCKMHGNFLIRNENTNQSFGYVSWGLNQLLIFEKHSTDTIKETKKAKYLI